MNDSLTTFCSQCGRPVRVPSDAADEESLACPWCQASSPAAELRQALPPLMFKATPAPSAEAQTSAKVVESKLQVGEQVGAPRTGSAAPILRTGRQRDGSRGKQKSPAWELAKIVLGGVAGLAIGYAILIYFVGQRADFLKLGPKLPRSIAPRWVDPAARAEFQEPPSNERSAPPPEVELDRALAAVQAAWEAGRLTGPSGAGATAPSGDKIVAAYRRLEAPLSQMDEARIAQRATELAYWLQRAAASATTIEELAADSFESLEVGQVFVAVGEVRRDAAGEAVFHLRDPEHAEAPSAQAPIRLAGRELFDEPVVAFLRAARTSESGSLGPIELQFLAYAPLRRAEASETPVASSRSQ